MLILLHMRAGSIRGCAYFARSGDYQRLSRRQARRDEVEILMRLGFRAECIGLRGRAR